MLRGCIATLGIIIPPKQCLSLSKNLALKSSSPNIIKRKVFNFTINSIVKIKLASRSLQQGYQTASRLHAGLFFPPPSRTNLKADY